MDYLGVIERESARFRTAVDSAEPVANVPTCPEWTVDDLLWHLTEVHSFWAEILRSRAVTDAESEAVEAAAPARPESRTALLAAFDQYTADLLDQLQHRADPEPAWFWLSTAQTVGSTRRMQAHEALMHRIDAEIAAGIDVSALDPDIAADGIRHAFEVMWAWWGTLPGFGFTPVARPVALRASDHSDSWLVQAGRWRGRGQSGTEYDQPGAILIESGDPAAVITGTVAELDRWLWGRGDEPATEGDPESLAALREARAAGMQ